MARPSKKAERTEEILDAYERCVVRFGVEGATLQKVADECGLARPLLHHYVGNREDLLDALMARFAARSEAEDAELQRHLPATGRCRATIELLFDARYASSSHDILLYQALMVAAQGRPALSDMLRRWYQSFVNDLSRELAAEYPRASADAVQAVATGIVALYFNADSMAPLMPAGALFADSKAAALRLLETL